MASAASVPQTDNIAHILGIEARGANTAAALTATGASTAKTAQTPGGRKPYAKADRSVKACRRCHSRKTRCSGTQPCQFCAGRNLECIYDEAGANNGHTKLEAAEKPKTHESKASLRLPGGTSIASIKQDPSPHALPHLSDIPRGVKRSRSFDNQDGGSNPFRVPSFTSSHGHGGLARSPYSCVVQPPLQALTSPVAQSPTLFNRETSLTSNHSAPNQDTEHSVSGLVLTRFQRIATESLTEPDICKMLDRRSSVRCMEAYFSEAEWMYHLWPNPDIPRTQLETIWAEEEARASQRSRTNTEFPNSLPPGARTVICALLAFGAMFERRIEDGERLYLAARRCYMDILELLTYESVQLAMQMAVFEINSNRSRNLWSTLAVATRTAHALNLHRKPALSGKSPEERIRRTQLWWCTRVHDIWHSLSTGRPALTSEADIDLDSPYEMYKCSGEPQVMSPLFSMRVRISGIWTHIHDQLYQGRPAEKSVHWLNTLPRLELELHQWHSDMISYFSYNDTTSRGDKMQFHVLMLAHTIIRVIMHRSFLIQRDIQDASEAYRNQRSVSESAILGSALQVLEQSRRLVRLGMHLSFWFIISDIQIACLALCEYIQNFIERGLTEGDLLAQPQEGLQTAITLLEEIEQSNENPAVTQVLEAVKTIQEAVRPTALVCAIKLSIHPLADRVSKPAQPPAHYAMPADATLLLNDPMTGSNALGIDMLQTTLPPVATDMDWLYSLTNTNIMDGFVSSSAPAASQLAWWLNPHENWFNNT